MRTKPERIEQLRSVLAKRGLFGFIVPLTDEHMSEYVGAYAERLKWLTGFDGSAGLAIVLQDRAAIFVDGRYTLQVRDQVDPELFDYETLSDQALFDWIARVGADGMTIGYDPELTTRGWVTAARSALARSGITLTATSDNPVDEAWADQPDAPMAPVIPHKESLAGEKADAKRRRIADILKKKGADIAAVTMLDSIAWAFNIRGQDVLHTPVVHAFALLSKDATAELFVDARKVDDNVRSHLGPDVTVLPREAFYDRLAELSGSGLSILCDPDTNNSKVFETVIAAGGVPVEGADPCILMKAIKNEAEVAGSRAAHLRDGAAVCDFLAWFDHTAPSDTLTEITAAEELAACRARHGDVKDQSFDTISGAGPNGAIIHYRVSEETNRRIRPGDMYLVDSGAQYEDGTTDITRTTVVGPPTDEMRTRYTLVLKGHIALARAVFPAGTSGQALDAIARQPLWQAGLDYAHGTGHGVGSYLAVHEGPQRIAKHGSSIPLEAGMILSNEPGYYEAGAYGIRIENLILVTPLETASGQTPMFGFETLTLAPFEPRLIDPALLTAEEVDWVNRYHARVRAALTGKVSAATRDWLERVTQPLGEIRHAAE